MYVHALSCWKINPLLCYINGTNTGCIILSTYHQVVKVAFKVTNCERKLVLIAPKTWCYLQQICNVQGHNCRMFRYTSVSFRSAVSITTTKSWFAREQDPCPVLALIQPLSSLLYSVTSVMWFKLQPFVRSFAVDPSTFQYSWYYLAWMFLLWSPIICLAIVTAD